MNNAIKKMLDKYSCRSEDDYINALREILQEIALLGLWRSKFFEHAAFYGGTALRILYGLDRYSEDLDFSLLAPDPNFTLKTYGDALRKELMAFDFTVDFELKNKNQNTNIESAFLKSNTKIQLITIGVNNSLVKQINPNKNLKIKLEVDVNPPMLFNTEDKYLFSPIPYAVKTYCLPDLFAGKLHAVLCRKWASRHKGRDWYDMVWYVGNHPYVNLTHMEQRMRQSGDWEGEGALTLKCLHELLLQVTENVNIDQIRIDVEPFVKDREALNLWSKQFFKTVIKEIKNCD